LPISELITSVEIRAKTLKIVAFDNILLLGQFKGYLEVVDLNENKIVNSHKFDCNFIFDIIVLSVSEFLLATDKGVMRTKKDSLIKQYYQDNSVFCMC